MGNIDIKKRSSTVLKGSAEDVVTMLIRNWTIVQLRNCADQLGVATVQAGLQQIKVEREGLEIERERHYMTIEGLEAGSDIGPTVGLSKSKPIGMFKHREDGSYAVYQ